MSDCNRDLEKSYLASILLDVLCEIIRNDVLEHCKTQVTPYDERGGTCCYRHETKHKLKLLHA